MLFLITVLRPSDVRTCRLGEPVYCKDEQLWGCYSYGRATWLKAETEMTINDGQDCEAFCSSG